MWEGEEVKGLYGELTKSKLYLTILSLYMECRFVQRQSQACLYCVLDGPIRLTAKSQVMRCKIDSVHMAYYVYLSTNYSATFDAIVDEGVLLCQTVAGISPGQLHSRSGLTFSTHEGYKFLLLLPRITC